MLLKYTRFQEIFEFLDHHSGIRVLFDARFHIKYVNKI